MKKCAFDEAKGQDVPEELFKVVVSSGKISEDFLKRKHAARKKYPELARQFDSEFPGRIDPNMEGYKSAGEDFAQAFAFLIVFLLFAFMGLQLASNGEFSKTFGKESKKLHWPTKEEARRAAE